MTNHNTETESLIACEHAAFGYENQIYADDVTFTLKKGDYLCILGENGSGKSTLMKGLLGLIKPYKGQVSGSFAGKSIGYLPQQSGQRKEFPATVKEVVMSGILSKKGWYPFYSREDKKLAAKQMERLQIIHLAEESFQDLSGGQQQRVLLARALCAAEELLLLDEPVTGLDPSVTKELYEILRDLNQREGTAIIMVSHDLGNALSDATHILHMEREMLFFGKTEDYKNSECGKAYLQIAGGDRL